MSAFEREVVIDCFWDDVSAYRATHAIVAVDVIRATTTLVTAAELGRACYPVPSLEAAVPLAARLHQPLLAGELGGNMPYGFHVNNSPAEFAERDDVDRPAILLSSSGTRLLARSQGAPAVFAACLRNWSAQVERLARSDFGRVAIVGAGTRGEFRDEDQLCCSWLAAGLMDHGFRASSTQTSILVDRWRGVPAAAISGGHSAEYLRRTGQTADLEFVLDHVDDLTTTFVLEDEVLVAERSPYAIQA